jgi:cell division protein FtsQ
MRRLIAALFPRLQPAPRGRRKPLRRRRRWSPQLRLAVRYGAISLAVLAVAGSALWSWQSGRAARAGDALLAAALRASAQAGLTVEDVLLEGRHYTPRAAVLAAVALERGEPILRFDPKLVRARLLALPWIRGASVERQLPDTVVVRIVERRPLALWQRKGRLVLVDDAGEVITARRLGRFRDLPIIIGRDAPENAAALLRMLAGEPGLRARVRAATRIGKRRWTVRLDNGIEIRLPENNAADAWQRLARLERKHKLLAGDVVTVDLRLPDQMILRTRAPRRRLPAAGGRDT